MCEKRADEPTATWTAPEGIYLRDRIGHVRCGDHDSGRFRLLRRIVELRPMALHIDNLHDDDYVKDDALQAWSEPAAA